MIDNSKHRISLLFSAVLVALLGGCSTLEKHLPGIGGGTPGANESRATEGVYYAATPDLPLYRSPDGVIITRLPQYAKLYRDQLDRGFAHVRVESTGETGWVENAKLTWRRPTHSSPQQTDDTASKPATAPASPQPVDAAAPPSPQATEPPRSPAAVPPSSAPSTRTVAPSIFNPY